MPWFIGQLGGKTAKQDESTAPGMPERERQESGDDAEDKDEDVEMENEDQDEIDRLVRESKRTAGGASDDDVDMTDRAEHKRDLEATENVRPQTTK